MKTRQSRLFFVLVTIFLILTACTDTTPQVEIPPTAEPTTPQRSIVLGDISDDPAEVIEGSHRLPPALLTLARRMADEYGCGLGEALDATVPAAAKRRGRRRIPFLELGIPLHIAKEAIAELENKRRRELLN